MTLESAVRNIAWFILLVLWLGPAFAVEIPAMLDYPDHLARMYMLSREATAAANPFYQLGWALFPNLAMDLTVPWLAHFTSVEVAAKAFYVTSQLLVIGGALMLERIIKGRIEIAPLAAGMFLYSPPFAWGFVNFEFGVGAAMWAIAAWCAMERRGWFARALVHCIFVMILFVAHLFALGVYGAVVGLHQLWRIAFERTSMRETTIAFAVLAAPVTALLAVKVLLGGSIGGTRTVWYLAYKPTWIALAMSGYSVSLSAVGMFFLISASIILARQGQLKLVRSGTWIAVGLALLYLAMPSRPLGVGFADIRILTAAAFILPAFVQLSVPNAVWRQILFAGAAGIAVANLILVWSVWLSYRPQYAAIITSFKQIDRGSKVLVAESGERDDLSEYPIRHAPDLAVPEAGALVSTYFAHPGQQPVALDPAYRQLGLLQDYSVSIAVLLDIVSGKLSNPPAPLISWPDNFDYLYVTGHRVPNPLPGRLDELAEGSQFVLYKIKHY